MKTEWIESSAEKIRLPDLRGKTALVTGASSGIGKATVDLLLENGVRVFGISRDPLRGGHPDFLHSECDLSDPHGSETAFREIANRTERLDYVVNVAGIDPKHAVDETTVAQWDQVLNLNLRAYYFVIQAALPLLRRGTGRSIVNVSSINYRLGVPGRSAYSASKAGILGLTTGLSRGNWGRRISGSIRSARDGRSRSGRSRNTSRAANRRKISPIWKAGRR